MGETMREFWDHAAATAAADYSATGFHDLGAEFIASGKADAWTVTRHLGVRLERSKRMLEIGPGAGRTTAEFVRVVDQVVAADVSPGMLEQARRTIQDASNLELVPLAGDGSLPFDDGSFDLVFAQHTIMHVPSVAMQLRYVRETARVLSVGGVGLIQVGRTDLRSRATEVVSNVYHRAHGRRSLSRLWRGARPRIRDLHDAVDSGVRVSVLNLEERFLWLVLRRVRVIE